MLCPLVNQNLLLDKDKAGCVPGFFVSLFLLFNLLILNLKICFL
ncbi:hypothetical protein imdm_587 [gamma proteobacterium IMCC2047]|nr:hypothetical protein imdm_587 [gamma proteobacterium IMCC2047]